MSSPGSSSQSSSRFELALKDAGFCGGAGSFACSASLGSLGSLGSLACSAPLGALACSAPLGALACSAPLGALAELVCSPPASARELSSRVSPLEVSALGAGESPPPCCSEGPCPRRSFSSGVVLFSSVFIRASRAALI
jgi:hypothetical protein